MKWNERDVAMWDDKSATKTHFVWLQKSPVCATECQRGKEKGEKPPLTVEMCKGGCGVLPIGAWGGWLHLPLLVIIIYVVVYDFWLGEMDRWIVCHTHTHTHTQWARCVNVLNRIRAKNQANNKQHEKRRERPTHRAVNVTTQRLAPPPVAYINRI